MLLYFQGDGNMGRVTWYGLLAPHRVQVTWQVVVVVMEKSSCGGAEVVVWWRSPFYLCSLTPWTAF